MIIGAGVSKTGTTSLAEALRMLGYNVYDFMEQISFLDEWSDLIHHGKIPDFQAMFRNVDALTDTPASFFFEEILQAFPGSKVILTIREEESWAKSRTEHCKGGKDFWAQPLNRFALLLSPTMRKAKRTMTDIGRALLGSAEPGATQIHRKHLHMHNERVKSTVPSDQLLIYNVKQGWEPLCEFLGKAVPREPFPRANVGSNIVKSQKPVLVNDEMKDLEFGRQILREVGIRSSVLLAGLAVVAYFLVTYFSQ